MHHRRKDSSVTPLLGRLWAASRTFVLSGLRHTAVLLLVSVLLVSAGCSGCNSANNPQAQAENEDETVEERKKRLAEQQKKKKPPREVKPLTALVGQEPPPEVDEEEGEQPTGKAPQVLLVKPGHWTTTTQEMKSNYDDFVGSSSTTLVDSNNYPVTLAHTNFTFQSTRPVALAKGRAKRIEGELFIPEQSRGIKIRAELRNNQTGSLEPIPSQPLLQKMPSYQYFVVVLAKEISQYAFLKVTDAVRMPWEEEDDAASQAHYRVHLADATKRLPLPSNPLTWTSVAHVVWDEVDPTRLTSEQQSALLDWIHWGGRLIINGPDSFDSLRGSFLEQYLPVKSTGQRTLAADDLSGWSEYWSQRDRGKNPPALQPTKPWSGLELAPLEGTRELAGGGQLFFERNVGRGTVVVSAIQLAERDFINWPGYDSFLNGALFRRPRRFFREGPYGGAQVGWVDFTSRRLDAHFATGLRVFARDSKTKANQWSVEETVQNLFGPNDTVTRTNIDRVGGIGTWSNFNPVASAARDVLTDAAAVRVPGAGFVLSSVGLYLVILVPFNWMVFRTLNRVEWAWIAAPIVALLGTLVIVRQAQLDIGFVRSQTEVALLELQDDYPRGLLSRFTALYSSLSTTYDVEFDSPTAIATPFPSSTQQKAVRESIWDVVFEKQNETELRGLAVSSASTKMVHSEEIFTCEGPLRLSESSRGHLQLDNRLGYDLRDVAVVRRYFKGGDERYESCWLGELENGKSAVLGLQSTQFAANESPFADERMRAASENPTLVDVEGLSKIAFDFPGQEDPMSNRRDEYRVVGLIDQVLPGTQVAPAASQIIGSTVMLAHLGYGPLPASRPDVNSRNDVIKLKPQIFGVTP